MTVTYPSVTQPNSPADDRRRGSGRDPLPMTGGRRAALLFGVPVCLALIAATGLSFAADLGQSSFPVRYTFPASATQLKVSVGGGQLTLGQAAISRATLTGTAHYSLVRPRLIPALSGNTASYDYHCWAPIGNCALDATVTVPAGMAASVSTGGGNASVTGTTGAVSLNSDGGDVSAQDVSGPVTLSTGGGNITADNVSAAVTLNTEGGDIQASAVRSAGLTASSGGGNITITFTTVPRDVNVSTAGGDITIVVPRGATQYHLNASTDGGSITDGTIPQNSASPHEITATSGGGNILIEQASS
jgi:hypothetical protein